jgi:hypothetical protein
MMDKITNRFLGLLLAVINHGLANLANDSKPARSNTVMDTAEDFEDFLDGIRNRPKRD